MIRGTTPSLTFTLPIETSTITALNLAIAQFGKVVISHGLDDVKTDGKAVTYTLTEEETLRLRATNTCSVQLRIGVGEARMASQVFVVPVDEILKDGPLNEL